MEDRGLDNYRGHQQKRKSAFSPEAPKFTHTNKKDNNQPTSQSTVDTNPCRSPFVNGKKQMHMSVFVNESSQCVVCVSTVKQL